MSGKRKDTSNRRQYGRQYVIGWDDETGRYHVTLGKDNIGFHTTQDGARAIAAIHARQVSLSMAAQYAAVTFKNAE